ncbi:PLP-dependent aminotransferase family protein [Ponticoccus sp. SC2-23]|uniref:MocR-like pyridoxine biosynthesis transcription factor PdxR n=1 Tax=Alexandriicola marinus TaxID=2081710 RepID=UPI000FDB46C9|nr:PLP-dependent aminotransferase family protein [Alexandriicola marinus]MBM1222158.1 PLP-dependent aminotransferase family protein [Ponticoccus sp. SC6-9]MBM1226845.1 PLP-dependent aminotransferase family protein [Ponticoccus sp. SC6-15]MBM1231105.1 PLP-dependent aminotransferase family protein [Ponticoccus sp. SC6-38]MBM1235643.1 PLP-dependent aminotransferase family protein [Ponticoccus sp. SC6-45]MBM1240127.1 PLP-dependent aminotransferase family protein [Ponticoccus sp. SC6-49]MBM1244481
MIPTESFLLQPTEGTLQSRIQQMVAEGILSGRFRPGERLPSSRRLAVHLGVSRITVTLAYTELVADDYLVARGRSGYFVSENAPQPPDFKPAPKEVSSVNWGDRLGPAAPSLGLTKPRDWQSYRFNFIYGQPDPDLFDAGNWRLCALRALGRKDFNSLSSDQFDQDDPLLIDFISRQTLPRRGILAGPDEILLTLGAQNALWLTAQLLLREGRSAVIETPCYPSLRSIVASTRASHHAVPVDRHGLDPGAIPQGTDVAFVTPGHHCPTTATMPHDRRRRLLDLAEAQDMLVVEDDYDFEMSVAGGAAPALKSLDTRGRVIHVGSFSKSIFPGLRLGYLVGPPDFISAARALRATVLRHPPGHVQRTTAYFLSLGHYDAQIRRMGRAYAERRRIMTEALTREGLWIEGSDAHGGSSLWMRAPDGVNTTDLAERLKSDGVLIEPGRAFFGPGDANDAFYRLGYSSIPTGRIAEGIARIRAAMG